MQMAKTLPKHAVKIGVVYARTAAPFPPSMSVNLIATPNQVLVWDRGSLVAQAC